MQEVGSPRNVIQSVTTSHNDSMGLAKIMTDAGYPRVPVMGDRDFYHVDRLRKRIGAVNEAVKFGLSVIPFLPHIIPHIEQQDWPDAEVLSMSRGVLKKFGMTKSGWKYLLSMPPERSWLLSNVPGGRDGESMRGIVRRIQALAEIGTWPKRIEAVENVFDRHLLDHEYEPEVRDTLLIICKRMWEQADTMPARSGKYREYLGHTLDVIDWFDDERPRFDKNQKNSSWETIYARVKVWHAELRERQAREAAERLEALRRAQVVTKSWGTLIDRMNTDDGYEVVPLVTEVMLINEGEHMGHCVGRRLNGYAERCREGHTRIFSIRKNGMSKATLEIGAGAAGGTWRIQQIRGPENTDVSDRLATIGNRILTDWKKKREKGEEEFFPSWANDVKYLGEVVAPPDLDGPGR